MPVGERRRRISEELVGTASLSFDLCQAPPTDDHDLGENASPDPSPPAARSASAQAGGAAAAVQFREGIAPRIFGGGKEIEIIRQELNDHDAKARAALPLTFPPQPSLLGMRHQPPVHARPRAHLLGYLWALAGDRDAPHEWRRREADAHQQRTVGRDLPLPPPASRAHAVLVPR